MHSIHTGLTSPPSTYSGTEDHDYAISNRKIRPLTFNDSRFYHTCSSLDRDAEIMSYAARISTPDPKGSGV